MPPRLVPRKRRPTLRLLAAVLTFCGAGALLAQDPPHWAGTVDIDCTSQCHVPHQASGGGLTQAATNSLLCQSCHNASSQIAGDLPISDSDKAVPGTGGTSHAFEVDAVNAAYDTQEPTDTQMNLRIMGTPGQVVCSTCHNQHRAEAAYGGASRIGDAKLRTSFGSIDGVDAAGTFTGPAGLWYLVEITRSGNETTADFGWSKDGGLTWFPTGCDPDVVNSPNCEDATGGTPVALDNGVTVTFATGSYVDEDQWEFSAAWPYLRWGQPATADALIDTGDNATGDKFCRDCHDAWARDTTFIEEYNGGAVKGHPVGVAMPTTEAFRSGTPRDADGKSQGASDDTNPTNDLLFDLSGNIQCLTCHGVHFVDSNSETVDSP